MGAETSLEQLRSKYQFLKAPVDLFSLSMDPGTPFLAQVVAISPHPSNMIEP